MNFTMQKSDYEFIMVKKELDCQVVPNSEKTPKVNEHLYMKVIAIPVLSYLCLFGVFNSPCHILKY